MVFYINDGLVPKNLRIVCLDEAIQVAGMQSCCMAESQNYSKLYGYSEKCAMCNK